MDAAAKRQAARAQTAPRAAPKNPRLYQDKAGKIKAARPKKPKQVKKAAFSPPARGGDRPEDKYGVHNRRSAISLVASADSRSRDSLRVGAVA